MSDPAMEAAQRVNVAWGLGEMLSLRSIDTAREVLEPLRELHRPVRRENRFYCHTCWNSMGYYKEWPCATAPLIYTTEELESHRARPDTED